MGTLTLRNLAKEKFTLDLGWNREGSFLIRIGKKGEFLERTLEREPGLARTGEISLAPSEEYKQGINLGKWFEFRDPGEYDIQLIVRGEGLETEVASINIVDNPDLAREKCKEIVREALSRKGELGRVANEAIADISSPSCIEQLRRAVLDRGNRAMGALSSLARIGTDEAREVLVAATETLGCWDLLQLRDALQQEIRKSREKDSEGLEIAVKAAEKRIEDCDKRGAYELQSDFKRTGTCQ